jgi:hypothetical protein
MAQLVHNRRKREQFIKNGSRVEEPLCQFVSQTSRASAQLVNNLHLLNSISTYIKMIPQRPCYRSHE